MTHIIPHTQFTITRVTRTRQTVLPFQRIALLHNIPQYMCCWDCFSSRVPLFYPKTASIPGNISFAYSPFRKQICFISSWTSLRFYLYSLEIFHVSVIGLILWKNFHGYPLQADAFQFYVLAISKVISRRSTSWFCLLSFIAGILSKLFSDY